jgi:hypothetical protein
MPGDRNNFGVFDRFDAQMQFTGTAAPPSGQIFAVVLDHSDGRQDVSAFAFPIR